MSVVLQDLELRERRWQRLEAKTSQNSPLSKLGSAAIRWRSIMGMSHAPRMSSVEETGRPGIRSYSPRSTGVAAKSCVSAQVSDGPRIRIPRTMRASKDEVSVRSSLEMERAQMEGAR